MSRLQKRLATLIVLFFLFAGINYLFYRVDQRKILQEAQKLHYTDVKISWQFNPVFSFRYYKVEFLDVNGRKQRKRVIIEISTLSWRDYPDNFQ
ncbi:MAG TPA: hypothetical protein PK581_04425 [Caldisericia bacterium]|nr:hypothetical protein [Caldisericia bacterium]